MTVAGAANAAQYYFGGYDATNSVQGTPDAPATSPFVVSGQTTFYSDAAGTSPNAAGTGFVTASDTSAELVLGGGPTAANYIASTPSSTGTVAIRGIALTSTNPGQNTLNLGFTSGGRYSIASGGSGLFGVGITLNGTSDWLIANGGAANSPIRLQNSASISGSGTGTLTIPFNIANSSGGPSLTVALPNGKLVLSANNDFGSNSGTAAGQFTLSSGTVDFQSARPFGVARNQVRLNGGTLTSSTGTTMSTVYTGTAQTGAQGGILIGGNLTFTGAVNWSLGTSTVNLTGNRTITANTAGTTGTTIAGVLGDNGGAFGLTVAAASTGKLTLTGANTYTGTTTIAGGTLALGANAQAPVFTGAGGADLQGGKLLLDYTGGSSPVASVKSILDLGYAGNFATGQIKSTTLAAGRTIGYGDNGTDTVTLRITLAGDADLDGDVDFNDFLVLQSKFGQANTRFDEANFNYDGFTDFNDFLALQANFGQSVTGDEVAFTSAQVAAMTAFASVVPEPASLTLIGMGAAGLLGRRRR
ncbi:MAG: PEP-CTERM sorting domain-containing protein [Tepidisphaeraceae bacterium]